MRVLHAFDPWNSRLCTCPPKYSFNPYTGCSHNCLYCYATYIPRFWNLREKKNLYSNLRKDLEELPPNSLISMSNSSDPYPPAEKNRGITRACLEILREYDARVLVVTKSNIVSRDAKLLAEMRVAVAITITSSKANKLERNAPSSEERILALKELKDAGVPVILRLDPLLPWDDREEWADILHKCDFVDHVVTSTLKLKRDAYSRLMLHHPELKAVLEHLYLKEGARVGRYIYLNKTLRENMLKFIAEKCEEIGISYGFCREGISFSSKSCDGNHLVR